MESQSKRVSYLPSKISFGDSHISSSVVVLSTENIIAIVDQFNVENGNVIIFPKKKIKQISELNEAEAIDIFVFAQKIMRVLEVALGRGVQLVVRDGVHSGDDNGQCCLHLIPSDPHQSVSFRMTQEEIGEVDYPRVKAYALKLMKMVKKELNSASVDTNPEESLEINQVRKQKGGEKKGLEEVKILENVK